MSRFIKIDLLIQNQRNLFGLTSELNILTKKTPSIELVAAFTLNGMLKSGSGVCTNNADETILYHYVPYLY